jgi:hypothetical protein
LAVWQPISEDDLLALIAAAEPAMEPPARALWERIRLRPVQWALPPWGDQGGGFWVVAVVGQECVWYNDIEDGFNVSRFEAFGHIADYRCNQSELHHTMPALVRQAETGEPPIRLGPPQPLPFDAVPGDAAGPARPTCSNEFIGYSGGPGGRAGAFGSWRKHRWASQASPSC